MSDELKTQMTTFASKMMELVEAGFDAGAREIPLLVSEWLQWQMFQSGAVVVGCWLFLAFVYYVAVYLVPGMVKSGELANGYHTTTRIDANYASNQGMGRVIFAIMATFVHIVGVFPWLFHLLKVIVAPRVVILEWVRSLV